DLPQIQRATGQHAGKAAELGHEKTGSNGVADVRLHARRYIDDHMIGDKLRWVGRREITSAAQSLLRCGPGTTGPGTCGAGTAGARTAGARPPGARPPGARTRETAGRAGGSGKSRSIAGRLIAGRRLSGRACKLGCA